MSVPPSRAYLLSPDELQLIHDTSLAILADPGMGIHTRALREGLQAAGAEVDETSHRVRIPGRLVEDCIEHLQAQIHAGRQQRVLNGAVASLSTPASGVKFGGACIEVYDWAMRLARPPTRRDLVDLVRLGEFLPEVGVVGNPVAYLSEDDAIPVDPRLQRVKTAALVARYTRKAGSTEVWNAKELPYLMELGQIVRGSREAYLANPCFVTAKETISPLVLEEDAGAVLLLLAQNDLPCTVIPMPLSGGSSPLTKASTVALGNAEILGTFVALLAVCPGANCVGGVISGLVDMRSGGSVFGAPEALLQDAALAELHGRLYGFDFGIGGYIDGKYPGAQACLEVMARFSLLASTGRHNVPVGLLAGGRRFSAEHAMIGLEVEQWIVESMKGLEVNPETLRLDQIRRIGIGGHSLMEEHTLEFMRRNVWYPRFMDRTLPDSETQDDQSRDMLAAAHRRVEEILAREDLYEVDPDQLQAIDEVVRAAGRELTALSA
jgi:trimethylamine--corrinoid protein Co-methyltransferase